MNDCEDTKLSDDDISSQLHAKPELLFLHYLAAHAMLRKGERARCGRR